MTTDHDERLDIALEGFHTAMLRAQEAIANAAETPPGEADRALLIAIMEPLWWASSVDEEFRKQYGTAYTSARDADRNGRLIKGITYARNRGGHQRAIAVVHEGSTWPMRFPTTWGVFLRWRRAEEIPPADHPHHDNGKDTYRQHLEGERVDTTLDRVMAWFRSAERLLRSTGHP